MLITTHLWSVTIVWEKKNSKSSHSRSFHGNFSISHFPKNGLHNCFHPLSINTHSLRRINLHLALEVFWHFWGVSYGILSSSSIKKKFVIFAVKTRIQAIVNYLYLHPVVSSLTNLQIHLKLFFSVA